MVKIGVASVDSKYPAVDDILEYSATDAADIGFDIFKYYWSPSYASRYAGQTWADTYTDLEGLASDPAFASVISKFDTIFLTTYTFVNGENNDWINDADNDYLDAEYNELKAGCIYLLTNYSNTTFYIQNWEGDWALIGAFDEDAVVPAKRAERMAAFIRRRQDAINDARNAVPSSTCKIYHVLEGNRVFDDRTDRVHRAVLPHAITDGWSFSAYEIVNFLPANQALAEIELERRLRDAVRRIKDILNSNGRNAGEKIRFIIGETGWNEDESSFTSLGLDVGLLIQKLIDVCDDLGFVAVIHWQMYDNEEQSPGVPRGYGIRNRQMGFTAQGLKYLSLLTQTKLIELRDTGTADLHLVADDYTSGDWTSRVGGFTATLNGTSPTKASSSLQSRNELSSFSTTKCFSLAANAAHTVDGSTAVTYEFILKTPSSGTGSPCVFGFGGGSTPNNQGFVLNYNNTVNGDGNCRIFSSTTGGTYLGSNTAPGIFSGLTSKYHLMTVVINVATPEFTVYANGVQVFQDLTTSGSLFTTAHGLGVGAFWTGAAFQTAWTGTIVEIMRHREAFTAAGVLSRARQFNNLKGY